MKESDSQNRKPKRLKRLCWVLAIVALIWAVVTSLCLVLPSAPVTLAREAIEAGELDAAAEYYQQHLANAPEDWNVRMELGELLTGFDPAQALIEFRQVPPDSEPYLGARKRIATICLASARYREAEDVLVELVQKMPENCEFQLTLAEVYFRQERPAAALPHAQKSAELNPEHSRTHFLVAELLDDLNRPSEMIAPLREVILLDPEDYPAHLNLSYAYAEAGQSGESRREAEWCLSRNPADVNARRFLGMAARAEGNADEALLEIQKALALAPDDLECRLVEAELLLFKQQPEKAFERLKPFYERLKDDRRLVALLARAAASSGRKEEAERYRAHVQKLSE